MITDSSKHFLYSFQCHRPNLCPLLSVVINVSYVVSVQMLALPFDHRAEKPPNCD